MMAVAAMRQTPAARTATAARFVAPAVSPARGAVIPAPAARFTPPTLRLNPAPRSAPAGELPEAVKEAVSSPGPGERLPPAIRAPLERSLDFPLQAVRVHADAKSRTAVSRLGSRAFTYGTDVFLGPGESASDLALMAHEVAHVVQQQGARVVQTLGAAVVADQFEAEAVRAASAVQRGERASVRERTGEPRVQGLGLRDALDYFARAANHIPGFAMLTFVIGLNPINMRRVERNATNLFRGLIGFLPGGNLIFEALQRHGILDRVGAWLQQRLASLGMAAQMFRDALDRFLDSLSWRDIFDLGGVWNRARRIFTEPVDRLIAFVRSLVGDIIRFIKDAILMPLARLASQTRGWDLLCAVLGRNPITGEAVSRNAQTLIGGFMHLIGQDEVWANIQRGNAVARAWAWFQGALAGVLAFVREVPTLFIQALRSLEIADIILVPRAFARVAGVFGGFVLRFLSWAGAQVLSLLQIIFEVVAPQVMVYIRRAAGALRTIIQDPIRFIGNLVRAGIQGFRQFGRNFLSHLRTSLIGWLTGTLSGANIYVPQAFNLREIIKFVLSVLGLTWQNIRQKLVRVMGETAVSALETTFDIVVTLVREGPAAAWEKIREQITNLREMVMEQIMSFVATRIVQAAITRLVTSLNPAGAFIQAVIAIYNTIMFFVERLRQIAQVVASFIDSLAAIASGVIQAAADRVERTMGGLLTLVISFLARLVGLGRVSDAVVNIVNRIRQPINRALDRVVNWIVTQARRLGRTAAGGARAAMGWLTRRLGFRTTDGQSHSIYFEQRAGQPTLMRASNGAQTIEDYLAHYEPRSDPNLARARSLVGRLRPLTRTPSAGGTPTAARDERQVVEVMTELVGVLAALGGATSPPPPPTPAEWTPGREGGPRSANTHAVGVELLSSTTATGGQQATGSTPEYQRVQGRDDVWVRMHLITAAVGGKGGPGNWEPAPSRINTGGAVRSFERALEQTLGQRNPEGRRTDATGSPVTRHVPYNVVWVTVRATLGHTDVTPTFGTLKFASLVSFQYGLYRYDESWIKIPRPLSSQQVVIPPP